MRSEVTARERITAVYAASGFLIAFIGVCHEVVGEALFPYGPAVFGGPVGWHAFGALIVAVGLWIFAAVLWGRRSFVLPVAILLIPLGLSIFAYAATRGDFHLFALAGVAAMSSVVVCERRLRALGRDGEDVA
jgi:hypothetical protein